MAVNNDQMVNTFVELISKNEEFMTLWKSMTAEVVMEAQDPSFARFSQAMIAVARQELKPVFSDLKASFKPETNPKTPRASKDPVDNTWRTEQKALFSGRGMQWIYVDIDIVNDILNEDDEVKPFFDAQGKAWVRYSGPRIVDNQQMAAFELRNHGSKIPAPKNLVYLQHDVIMEELFERLDEGKTPFALGLESSPVENDEVEASSNDEGVDIDISPSNETSVEIDEDMLALLNDDDDDDINA